MAHLGWWNYFVYYCNSKYTSKTMECVQNQNSGDPEMPGYAAKCYKII